MTDTKPDAEVRHGTPDARRYDRLGFDKYIWPMGPAFPRGLDIKVYDDGRVKISAYGVTIGLDALRLFGPSEKNCWHGGSEVGQETHPFCGRSGNGSIPHCAAIVPDRSDQRPVINRLSSLGKSGPVGDGLVWLLLGART